MPAYAIGAAFLLAALAMYGTLGGFLPRILHGSKYGLLALFVVLCVLAAYYWRLDLANLSNLWQPSQASAPPAPAPPLPLPPPATAKTKAPPRRAAAAAFKEEYRFAPAQPDASGLIPEAAPVADPPQEPAVIQRPPPHQDGHVKRAAKAVGRFFRKAAD